MTAHVTSRWFAGRLLKWYRTHGRQDLPWKTPHDPYFIWLSEIMLQQTQVSTVIPYFYRFIEKFPTLASLANAPQAAVLQNWAGLGYYARARNLHQCAQRIQKEHGGEIPTNLEDLIDLPGIGLSTAGAILSQAFDKRAPILDGNVKRVLSRFHQIAGNPSDKHTLSKLWALADFYTPKKQVADYTQAIMDLGATICTRTQPKCALCPINQACLAYQAGVPSDYPQKVRRKPIPHRQRIVLLISNQHDHILLEERPQKGIWGGLWSLPEFDDKPTAEDFVKRWQAHLPKDWEALPTVKHAFTHYRLTLAPYRIRLSHQKPLRLAKPFKWYDQGLLETIGTPAPIQKILNRYKEEMI